MARTYGDQPGFDNYGAGTYEVRKLLLSYSPLSDLNRAFHPEVNHFCTLLNDLRAGPAG